MTCLMRPPEQLPGAPKGNVTFNPISGYKVQQSLLAAVNEFHVCPSIDRMFKRRVGNEVRGT
jgi:hypothetical protein